MLNQLLELDTRLSARMRLPAQKSPLRTAAIFFAHSGDSWFLMAGLAIIWLFSHGAQRVLSAKFAFAIVVQAILVLVIKFTIRRSRPEGDWGGIYRSTDPHSFPSGHAARAAMLSFIATFVFSPWMDFLLALWAVLVGTARIALGVHYLVDVIGGWLIGIVIGALMLAIFPLLSQNFPLIF